jgi:hypothetical protein
MLLKNLLGKLSAELKLHKTFIALAFLSILLSYSVYLFLREETVILLGREDNLFENLTCLSFLAASVLFAINFYHSRNFFFLLLSIVFFIAMGEEISWGQRILKHDTIEFFQKHNVQSEHNLHNLEIINPEKIDRQKKTGISKYFTIDFFYKLFWLSYCFILPLAYGLFDRHAPFKLPLPPISIGLLFIISWLIYKITSSYILPQDRSILYYHAIYEIYEFCSAFLFMILSLAFLKQVKKLKAISE